ncbi:MAG: methyltransferase domain-containing protein [Myxococcota bacterium]
MPLSVIGGDVALDFYLRRAPRGAPVLILGAGEGELACALGRRGHEVVAVEPSSRLLVAAIARREAEAPEASIRFVNADPRTERLGRLFLAVLLPRNALALARTDVELRALLATIEAHLAAEGVFALDALVESPASEARLKAAPHLLGRQDGQRAVHRLERVAVAAARLDELLRDVGLEARERYQDFIGTPATDEAELQVVVGGRR